MFIIKSESKLCNGMKNMIQGNLGFSRLNLLISLRLFWARCNLGQWRLLRF